MNKTMKKSTIGWNLSNQNLGKMIKKFQHNTYSINSTLTSKELKEVEKLIQSKEILHLELGNKSHENNYKFLTNNKTLKSLKISISSDFEKEILFNVYSIVASIIKQNNLEILIFHHKSKTELKENPMFKSLESNKSLNHLDITSYHMRKSDLSSLKKFLTLNRKIQTLKLSDFNHKEFKEVFSNLKETSLTHLLYSQLGNEPKINFDFIKCHKSLIDLSLTFPVNLNDFLKNINVNTNPKLRKISLSIEKIPSKLDFSNSTISHFSFKNFVFHIEEESMELLLEGLSNYSNLRCLKIANNLKSSYKEKKWMPLLQKILKNQTLEILKLGIMPMNEQDTVLFLDGLQDCKSLSILDLTSSFLAKNFLKFGEILSSNSQLTELSIGATIDFKKYISELMKNSFNYHKHLTILSLSSIHIEGDGMILFAKYLSNNKILKKLFLYNNHITNDDLKILCESLEFETNLEEIKFEYQNFNEDGLKYIGKMIEFNTSLKKLSFQTTIGVEGMKLLTDSIVKNKTLQYLHILYSRKYENLLLEGLFYNYSLLELNEEELLSFKPLQQIFQRNLRFIQNYYKNIPSNLYDLSFKFIEKVLK